MSVKAVKTLKIKQEPKLEQNLMRFMKKSKKFRNNYYSLLILKILKIFKMKNKFMYKK